MHVLLDDVLGMGERVCTCVLPSGAAGFCTSSTAVSRLRAGVRDTAELTGASGAVTAAKTWAVLLLPVHQQGHQQDSFVNIGT